MLRLHLASEGDRRVGWLFALADKRICATIDTLHELPSDRWTIAGVAREAAMSRTSLALHVRKTVGLSPADYLTRWRMRIAADRLSSTADTLPDIACSPGYRSEKASAPRSTRHELRATGVHPEPSGFGVGWLHAGQASRTHPGWGGRRRWSGRRATRSSVSSEAVVNACDA